MRFPSRSEALAWTLTKYRQEWDEGSLTLFPRNDTGFFSNCAFTLATLVHLAHLGIFPRRISFSRGYGNYKDPDSPDDTYPEFFRTDDLAIESIRSTWAPYVDLRCADHHTNYAVLPFPEIDPFIRAYFQPSDAVRALLAGMVSKYGIDFARTVGVCYRGTDKSIEVDLAGPGEYVEVARAARSEGMRVLVQTDQSQAKDLFLSALPDSFAFDEMPTTLSATVLHAFDARSLQMSKLAFGRQLVASTLALSRCRVIVNHCGNMALWIALFRGNAHGMVQFDRYGRRVGSGRAAMARMRNVARRARRWMQGDIAYYN